MYSHVPVLLQEVMAVLKPMPGSHIVDATLGGAGYTSELLKVVGLEGKVMSLDADLEAVTNARQKFRKDINQGRLVLVNDNFVNLAKLAEAHKFIPNGIVADLGLSSFELDQSGRGFSFQKDEVLDMRFGPNLQDKTAAQILELYSEQELVKVFKEYGEEKMSVAIARNIVRRRLNAPLKRTTELVEIIADSIPRRSEVFVRDVCRRIFQALRVEVNNELGFLDSFLDQAVEILAPGGRLVVVTFHSLEDRIVKHKFKDWEISCVCPKGFPICKCGKIPKGKILTKKPVLPSLTETGFNPRSKSAKLRAFEKNNL